MGLIELITNTGGILRRSDDFVPISSFPRRYPIRLCYILGLILSFIIEYHVSDFCQRFTQKIFRLDGFTFKRGTFILTSATVRLLVSWTKPGLVTFRASGNIFLVATINTTMLHVSGVSTDLIVMLKLNWGLTFYYLIVTRIKLFQVYLCYYALNAAEEC